RTSGEDLVRPCPVILADAKLECLPGLGGAEHAPAVRVEVSGRRPLVGTVVTVEPEVRAARAKREARNGLVDEEAVLVPSSGVTARVENYVLHAGTPT